MENSKQSSKLTVTQRCNRLCNQENNRILQVAHRALKPHLKKVEQWCVGAGGTDLFSALRASGMNAVACERLADTLTTLHGRPDLPPLLRDITSLLFRSDFSPYQAQFMVALGGSDLEHLDRVKLVTASSNMELSETLDLIKVDLFSQAPLSKPRWKRMELLLVPAFNPEDSNALHHFICDLYREGAGCLVNLLLENWLQLVLSHHARDLPDIVTELAAAYFAREDQKLIFSESFYKTLAGAVQQRAHQEAEHFLCSLYEQIHGIDCSDHLLRLQETLDSSGMQQVLMHADDIMLWSLSRQQGNIKEGGWQIFCNLYRTVNDFRDGLTVSPTGP